ncbi:MAG: NADH-quinone oxidoreductase subunit N [Planctomycetota bacterium]
MTLESMFFPLAPEWMLLIGAGVVLALGLVRTPARGSWCTATAFLSIAAALAWTTKNGVPDGSYAQLGLWLTPLTYYARCIALSIGAIVILVNWHQPTRDECGEYMALILASLLGILLTASANDLIVLFFAIELVSVPTYVLVALSRNDQRAPEAAVKYFFLGALAAALLAYGFSFLYGAAGTTTIHTVMNRIGTSNLAPAVNHTGYVWLGMLLALGGLGFKIAAVPFHAYVADVYEGSASPISGMLGFVPKFAGFVALMKLLGALHWDLPPAIVWALWAMAAATMTVGNVLALLQKNVKRILAYSSIAHTGYMLIALLVGPVAEGSPLRDGAAALLFYIAIYGTMNLGAFALLDAFERKGKPIETFDDLAGLSARSPATAFALAVCVFSLMGFPPTAGFLGKWFVFGSAFSTPAGHPFQGALIALAILGVVNSAIGAAYYLRIVASAYMGRESSGFTPGSGRPLRVGAFVCAAFLLLVFVKPATLTRQSKIASDSLRAAELSKLVHGQTLNLVENGDQRGEVK